ncbi:MAG: hypothetical protein Q7K42_00270 [Candidatus Diapherotrites archaeon]|nr:hypothetical protein [Candidatus Diapherotrites archaeon]
MNSEIYLLLVVNSYFVVAMPNFRIKRIPGLRIVLPHDVSRESLIAAQKLAEKNIEALVRKHKVVPDRWQRIHELRKQRKKFWEIADILTEEEGKNVYASEVGYYYKITALRLGLKRFFTTQKPKDPKLGITSPKVVPDRWRRIHELRGQRKKFWEIADILSIEERKKVYASEVNSYYMTVANVHGLSRFFTTQKPKER